MYGSIALDAHTAQKIFSYFTMLSKPFSKTLIIKENHKKVRRNNSNVLLNKSFLLSLEFIIHLSMPIYRFCVILFFIHIMKEYTSKLGRMNKVPVIRSHFVDFLGATNCFNGMWDLIQWKVGFYSYESGILFRHI